MSAQAAPPAGSLTSLILPAYNPGPSIKRVWAQLRDFVATAPGAWELLFVCDGCTDRTATLLTKWSAPLGERVRVLSYRPNRGKGFAVYRGLAAARGQWRLFTDVDLAYDVADILGLAQRLWGGAEAVVASRLHPQSRVTVPVHLQRYAYWRHLQSQAFSALVRRMLPLTLRDTQAGLKGFAAPVVERLLPLLRCRGFEFDCELLTACVRLGVTVTEMPVSVRYENQASTTSWRSGLSMVRGLWRIRRGWKAELGATRQVPELRAAA